MTTPNDRLKKPLGPRDAELPALSLPTRQPPEGTASMQSLFNVLDAEYRKDSPGLDPPRRASLDEVMNTLRDLVQSDRRDKTLEDLNADRGRIDRLAGILGPQGKKPSLKGPGPVAGSRSEQLLAALQDLKMFVWSAGMQQSARTGMRSAAIDLFPRIGRLTTWISEAGIDAARVRQLEWDQARGLAHEVRTFARRGHLTLARPVWRGYNMPVEANHVAFSGPSRVRRAFAGAIAGAGLETHQSTRSGADVADDRWRDIRSANVVVFDLSDSDPQVYYELGIAMTIGAQLLLIAEAGTTIPFDVAQTVRFYEPGSDVRAFIAHELDGAMYGLHVRSGTRSSLDRTLAYAERLSMVEGANPLSPIALRSMRHAGSDPVKFLDAVNLFNSYLGDDEHDILLPRWPGDYPDARAPRCFAVMPFRGEAERAYPVIQNAARQAHVEPVRGDIIGGQQIVESIWSEICRATHVTVDLTDFNPNVCLELGIAHTLGRPTRIIGTKGTEEALHERLPGAAKWRCYVYGRDAKSLHDLQLMLGRFFAKTEGL